MKSLSVSSALSLALIAIAISTVSVYSGASAVSPKISSRNEAAIQSLIDKMTLHEKVEMVSGNDPETHPVPRLHIPAITMNDGPLGLRLGRMTAFPSGLALGASFNPSLAEQEGHAIADEAKTKNVNMMLGPCVNIARQPFGGRNFESYGEDPLLSSLLAASYIGGMQSNGVIAVVKHFAGNEQEFERNLVSTNVDVRTLFEMHFPMFKAAVDAGVLSVMSSYNRLNGTYTSENKWLLEGVLKNLWGFKGFVVSDWTSTHSSLGPALGGLDLEMPTGKAFGKNLESAVLKGRVPVQIVDDKVRRILRAMFAIGLMGDQKIARPRPLGPESAEHQKLAQTIAEQGTVLLKNDGVLPIGDRVRSIAVIGPNAGRLRTGGSGSSQVIPYRAISPVDALRAQTDAVINYAEGTTIPGDVGLRLKAQDFKGGVLRAEYFKTIESIGTKPFLSRQEPSVELSTDPRLDDRYGVRFSGELVAPVSGPYVFSAANSHSVTLRLNGKKLMALPVSSDIDVKEVSVNLVKGSSYKLTIETGRSDDDTETSLQLGWRLPNPNRLQAAVAAARASDVAVLFLGLGNFMEGEGGDRESLDLPEDQVELLDAVASANPKTVVVLTGGGVFTMPWLPKVGAVMQAWYPGSEGGIALSRLLLGKANPSGHLPISYIRRWEDSSAYGRYPGTNHNVSYSEGLFVGYRFMDREKTTPLFPFGFGLSYTTFSMSHLKTSVTDSGAASPVVTLTFDVTNTGPLDGAEVAQVYVGEKHPSVPRPVRELKGFSRVELKSGETKRVSITLEKSAFAFFDVKTMSWTVNPNEFEISVGSSSRDLPLKTRVRLN